MEGFTDVEQYIRFFEHFLTDVVQDINQKREDRDWIVDFLQDYVQHHYSEDLSLDLVADKLNLSSGYVSKYYKEKTGVNFSDFLNEFRIQKAKELLQQSDYRIQDIAGQVGYFNVNSFIRMFRKVTGMPPGEYRRMHTLPDCEPYGPSIQQDA
jgi:YesN/AraC family two-component response regulator